MIHSHTDIGSKLQLSDYHNSIDYRDILGLFINNTVVCLTIRIVI